MPASLPRCSTRASSTAATISNSSRSCPPPASISSTSTRRSTRTATTKSSGARRRRSAPSRTATRAPRPTSTTCARAASSSPACSRRPAASTTTATGTPRHYVKVMLDQIFGENNFQNEIVWKRSSAHSDSKGRRCESRHDLLFTLANDGHGTRCSPRIPSTYLSRITYQGADGTYVFESRTDSETTRRRRS